MGRGSLGGVAALALLLLMGAIAPQVKIDVATATADAAPVLTRSVERAAPQPLIAVAQRAGGVTGVDPAVLLAISEVECDFGHCRAGQPDAFVPADVRGRVDRSALQPGGSTAQLLGIADGRRVGDWVNPLPVAGGQHAMGFMQFLPSTWRQEAPLAPGHPTDPYKPYDAMVAAGSYLARLQRGDIDGRHRSLRTAVAAYGGDAAYADRVLAIATA